MTTHDLLSFEDFFAQVQERFPYLRDMVDLPCFGETSFTNSGIVGSRLVSRHQGSESFIRLILIETDTIDDDLIEAYNASCLGRVTICKTIVCRSADELNHASFRLTKRERNKGEHRLTPIAGDVVEVDFRRPDKEVFLARILIVHRTAANNWQFEYQRLDDGSTINEAIGVPNLASTTYITKIRYDLRDVKRQYVRFGEEERRRKEFREYRIRLKRTFNRPGVLRSFGHHREAIAYFLSDLFRGYAESDWGVTREMLMEAYEHDRMPGFLGVQSASGERGLQVTHDTYLYWTFAFRRKTVVAWVRRMSKRLTITKKQALAHARERDQIM